MVGIVLTRRLGALVLLLLVAAPARISAPWGPVTAFEVFILPTLIVEILLAGKGHRRVLPYIWVSIMVAAFVGWALFSAFWVTDGAAWLTRIMGILEAVAAGWAAYLAAGRLGPWRAVGVLSVVGSVGAAWSLVWFYLLDRPVGFNLQPPAEAQSAVSQALRLGSPLLGPSNYYASFLLISIPVTLALAYRKKVYLLGVAVQLTALAFTVSRGAFLAAGFVCVLAIVVYYGSSRRLPHGFALAGTSLVFMIGLPFLTQSATALLSQRQLSSSGDGVDVRTELWSTALELWSDHFWIGSGLGSWASEVDLAGGSGAHNFLLQLGAELGVVGFAIAVIAILVCLKMALGVSDMRVRVAVFCAILASVLNCLVEASFEGRVYTWALGTSLGVFVILVEQSRIVLSQPTEPVLIRG
ncbi:O-antigen ligase family protein [Terrabacter tumescens]|nr:O-antigen ligase family protein [Terrabacter tumescens]